MPTVFGLRDTDAEVTARGPAEGLLCQVIQMDIVDSDACSRVFRKSGYLQPSFLLSVVLVPVSSL